MNENDLLEGGQFTTRAGRDGWLFLDTFDQEPVIDTYTGADPISDAAYTAWVEAIGRRADYFAEHGIAHLMLVVPDTCWVYRDKLPDDVTLAEEPPGEQIRARLDEVGAGQYLYPLEELIAARADHPTYRRTDSHWTDWGARVGMRAVVEALRARGAAVRTLPDDEISWSERRSYGALGVVVPEEQSELVRVARLPSSRCRTVIDISTHTRDQYFVVEQDRPELATAVVFRDSFMTAGHKFLSESFRRVSYVSHSQSLFYDLIESERPDVVVVEVAERRIRNPPVEPSLLDFRSAFGDLLLDDPEARAAQVASQAAMSQGDARAALAASDVVVALGANARAMMHRSRVLTKLREAPAALEALRTATTLDPEDAMAWCTLAQTASVRGYPIEAARAARRAVDLEPGVPLFWRIAATMALKSGDTGASVRLAQEGLGLFPDHPELHYTASRAASAIGALDDARTAVERALALDPDSALYRRELASVLIRAQDWAAADAALDAIVEDDVDLTPYRETVRRGLENGDRSGEEVR